MKNKKTKPVMLVILDGFGMSNKLHQGNATIRAHMPTWNKLTAFYPWILLHASGSHVGLLDGYIGNSAVGHLTIGAGRVVKSMLKRIHEAIADRRFMNHPILNKHFDALSKQGRRLHLMGLLSDGGVHSHIDHLYALIKGARDHNIKQVFIHAFLDGRDVAPCSASYYLEALEKKCKDLGVGFIASIHGRFYAMDRDNNWDRTCKSYETLCNESIMDRAISWREVLANSYHQEVYDEFILPTRLVADGVMRDGDGVVFYNFRPDRARQLSEMFLNPNFDKVPRQYFKKLACFMSMASYNETFRQWHCDVLFEQELIEHTLLDTIAEQRQGTIKTLVIAETEKYAHVTYFFRGMREIRLSHETNILVPSLKEHSYVQHPEMSAYTITQKIVASLAEELIDFYVVNYANADMVGHAGNIEATIKACEILDEQLNILYEEVVQKREGTLIITADHGNAEQQIDENGNPHTSHTVNPVPLMVITKDRLPVLNKMVASSYIMHEAWNVVSHYKGNFYIAGDLSLIAPMILQRLGLVVPQEMNECK
jgi:2,3-bisphosphoglycerate-independent phosphoglycerate mutase